MDKARDTDGNIVSVGAIGAMLAATKGFSTMLSVDDPKRGQSKIAINYFTTELPTVEIKTVHLLSLSFRRKSEKYPIFVLATDDFHVMDSWHAHEDVVADLNGQSTIWIHEKSNGGDARAYNVPLLRTVYALKNHSQIVIRNGPLVTMPGSLRYTSFGVEQSE